MKAGQFLSHMKNEAHETPNDNDTFCTIPHWIFAHRKLACGINEFFNSQKVSGEFILRIDDTDAERSKQEFIDSILFDLEWLIALG